MVPRSSCVLYIDGGTTRTRAWAVRGGRIVASARVSVGARDSAREGSSRRLSNAVRDLVREVGERCRGQGQPSPELGVAAGMITSSEGLVEVPHVEAPAGAKELARAAECRTLAEIGSLPIVFVPGIRSGPSRSERDSIGASDVMRGEEVLGIGLARAGFLAGGGVMLSLGSHWKAVDVDAEERVLRSTSTLAGELLHVIRSHTILASSVLGEWPPTLPPDWVAAGIRRGREDGLPRASYCVRLLDQRTGSGPRDRLAFLVGAMIAANERVLLPTPAGRRHRIVLAGAPALTRAWEDVIRERGFEPLTIDESERENAFRMGCHAVLEAGEFPAGGGAGSGWRPPR